MRDEVLIEDGEDTHLINIYNQRLIVNI